MHDFRRRIPLLAGTLLILAGGAVGLYPAAESLYQDCAATEVIREYEKEISHIPEEKKQQLLQDAENYNSILSKASLNPGSGSEEQPDYESRLNATEVMACLEIPKIQVYLPVYHGTGEETLQRGIGHMKESSLPVGGPSSHCVLSGHTGLPGASLFTRLDELQKGDVFFVRQMEKTMAYKVDQILTVLPQETEALAIEEGKDYVTLLTCVPYGVNSHRLLVRGHRVENVSGMNGGGRNFWISSEQLRILMILGAGTIVLLDVLLVLFSPGEKAAERQKRRERENEKNMQN